MYTVIVKVEDFILRILLRDVVIPVVETDNDEGIKYGWRDPSRDRTKLEREREREREREKDKERLCK